MFLPSLSGGGAESSMLRIATVLLDRGNDVELFTARDQQAANNRPDSRVRYRSFSRRHARSAVFDLRSALRASHPDVLLTAMDHANFVGLVAAGLSRTRTPVVISFRTDVVAASRSGRGPFSYVRPTLARLTVHRAAHVIAISEGVRLGLQRLAPGSADKVTTIYNPTIHPGIFDRAAEPLPASDDFELHDTILAVGRLSEAKGFDTLLRAFARIAPEFPDARLVILGEGSLRNELQSLARELGVADRFRLPGYAANPYQYMARCRVFAFSSRWEGLGNVLTEAGALGCTIVATDCPSGPRELLGGRGQATLVPVDDPVALANALGDALRTPHRRFEGAWTEHTMVESGRRYEQVLRDVVERRSHPR